ncbi:MAG: diphthine synthase [Methanophagales archaeon ANME-1-THS]|nr:MAG: diphthine synthase [Methanophagales archaeon ANME-1-THS]
MLTFVGLGLYDEKDITVKGLEAIRAADLVYAEFYTSPLGGKTVEKMEKMYGRKIVLVQRSDLEEYPEKLILTPAKTQNVVVLSGGDAMIATTHVDLRLRAIERGIETRIIHAPSISSAVAGLCGLQNYKFGKSATVSPPYKEVISEVPYETIRANKERGLHTLLYLDISMDIHEALRLLEAVEDQKGGAMLRTSLIVGIARAGSAKPVVKADYMEGLKTYDFGALPHVLVVPGELHFLEREALIKIAQAPEKI